MSLHAGWWGDIPAFLTLIGSPADRPTRAHAEALATAAYAIVLGNPAIAMTVVALGYSAAQGGSRAR